MRKYPKLEDKYDKKDLENINAEEWQLELLKLNPSYVHWGCYEDYMCKDKESWDSRVITSTWKEHKSEWNLDEYNELVNFYFEVYRKNHECEYCKGTALNPATKQISDDWYDFAQTGRRWDNKITEVEVEALMKSGRLSDASDFRGYYDDEKQAWVKWENGVQVVCEQPEFPHPDKINQWSQKGFGHDAINKWICVKARAKHLGVYGECEHCNEGYIYDEPKARVALQFWYLHPRKGCSRGVYIENIEQEDLPQIFEYLKEARDRNAQRFEKIV
jgi:hypothetical protein